MLDVPRRARRIAARPARPPGPRGPAAPQTVDGVKRQAGMHNEVGVAGRPYGVKVLIHNHTGEFQPFADDSTPLRRAARQYGSDRRGVPAGHRLGPRCQSGYSGNVRATPAALSVVAREGHGGSRRDESPGESGRAPACREDRSGGLGEIDYRAIFAHAADAGLEHYCIEQETAPDTGSLAAMRLSAENLRRALG